jgi:shikimate kinase
MTTLKNKYNIIWLDVDYDVIVARKTAEAKERPIVYPDGINSFLELYQQRSRLYEKYYDYKVRVTENEPIKRTIQKILISLINN